VPSRSLSKDNSRPGDRLACRGPLLWRYWLNQQRKHGPEVDEEAVRGVLAVESLGMPGPEALLLQRYRVACIRRAVARLPEPYRAVFQMSHVEGLTYAEIGERLRIPVGTVKSRMAEAVRRLRACLSAEGEI
jgi:RNA polymerase sigma factor (sigma-70 family)